MISWLIYLLPDTFVSWASWTLFFAGVALVLASWFIMFIPMINKYRFPAQIIGIVMLMLGSYQIGGMTIEQTWLDRVAQMEAKLAAAEAQSAADNQRIQTLLDQQSKINDALTASINDDITKQTKAIDVNKCEIPVEAIKLYNRAAAGGDTKK